MYGLSDRLKPLSAAEEQVLLAVWECPAPATRRDISEKLTATGWAPATVLNFLFHCLFVVHCNASIQDDARRVARK